MTKQEAYEGMIYHQQKLRLTEEEYNTNLQDVTSTNGKINNIKMALEVLNDFINKSLSPKIVFLENTISRGLNYIFDKDYKFKIVNEVKNNKNVYYFKLMNGDMSGDIDSIGGGVMVVISFLLRFNINIMQNKYKIMVLDESLNHLSASYQEKLSMFIKQLCKDFDTNIILITHQPKMSIHADIIYDFYKDGNVLNFRTTKNKNG